MNKQNETVEIWGKQIGDGHPPYFVAELGTCHQGDLNLAKENARAAVEAGADCVKTETYYETEVFDPSALKTYSTRTKAYSVSLIEHMRKSQLTLDQHHEIKKYCDQLGVPFMATVHEFEIVDFLADIGAAAVKIASPDIVHIPLIRYISKTNMVLFFDTGGSAQWEVEMAVKTARDAGCKQIVVNHNPNGHPAPPNKQDLLTIPRYKELFKLPVGLADHYDGYQAIYTAVALGANVIEKPITHDRFLEECEHIWSIDRKDLKEVITTLHQVYDSLGSPERIIPNGLRNENPNRVALAAKKDLEPGSIINLENITFGKPRMGLGVELWDLLEGKMIKKSKKKHEFIQWEDIF